jgi:hypothetical protein
MRKNSLDDLTICADYAAILGSMQHRGFAALTIQGSLNLILTLNEMLQFCIGIKADGLFIEVRERLCQTVKREIRIAGVIGLDERV